MRKKPTFLKTTISKMPSFGNQKKTASIAFMLMLLCSSFSAFALAQTYTAMPARDTFTGVGVSPTLIGVGQQVMIDIIVYPGPTGPTYAGSQNIPGMTLLNGYSNVSVTITDPDGTKDTFMPIDAALASQGIEIPGQTEVIGNLMFYYTPSKIGNYSVTASFPGKTYTTANVSPTVNMSVYYKPSSSPEPIIFTVQKENVSGGVINGAPYQPLPENYWTNPVQTNNREWAAISGNWPLPMYSSLSTDYNPYSTAPNSPHIVWSQPVSDAGLAGGQFGSLPYNAYAYIIQGGDVILLNGKLYKNLANGNFECVDLRTGKLLWTAPGSIFCAQTLSLPFQTSVQTNEGGLTSFLLGGISEGASPNGSDKWYEYSSFDGHILQTITNVPKDLYTISIDYGDPIVWATQMNPTLWNTTRPLKQAYVNLIKWNYTKLETTVGYANVYSTNWQNGVEWNVSAMTSDQVSISDNDFRGPTIQAYPDANVVIVRAINAMQTMDAFDYTTGAFLWKNNATAYNMDIIWSGVATGTSGPLITRDGASMNYVAYDVKTGQETWTASSGEYPWGEIPAYGYVYDNGVFYTGSFDGHVYAYNITNGKMVWQSDYNGNTTETIYGDTPFNGPGIGADGKLYYSSATDYYMVPRPRFHDLVCINETTGHFIWTLPMGVDPVAIADGYLVGEDVDNGILYSIGQGPTATTVSAPDTTVPLGTSIVISGTVMDESPGTQEAAVKAYYPNGVPAVSDADQATWMSFLYGQNATLLNNPPSPDGVSVTLSVLDSNGNYRQIGTTTTDASGTFAYTWTPDIPGNYAVIATFAGSNSYYPSSAETHFYASASTPATTTTNPATNSSMTDTYVIAGVVAIIIAIAIASAVIVLTLRKRP